MALPDFGERALDSLGVFPGDNGPLDHQGYTPRAGRSRGSFLLLVENLLRLSEPRKPQYTRKARLLQVPLLLPVPGFSGSPEPSSDPKDQKPEPGEAIGVARLEQVASECEVSASCLGSVRSCARVRVCGGRRAPRGDLRDREAEGGCHTGTGNVRVCVCVCARVCVGVRALRCGNALKAVVVN